MESDPERSAATLPPEDYRARVSEAVTNAEHVGISQRSVHIPELVFNPDDPQIKEDILRMIIQYLQNNNYPISVMTLQDEANVKVAEAGRKQAHVKAMKKCIIEGDWAEVEKLLHKDAFKNERHFQYQVYKQIFLELIEKHEFQKAFTYLTKRLKPLESRQSHPEEFRDLCYLLTCKSVHDATSFKGFDWLKGASREGLLEMFSSIFENDQNRLTTPGSVAPGRLLSLLQQAVSYQIQFSRYHPKVAPKVTTLLSDYTCLVLPNAERHTFAGHRDNVKCVEFIGEEGWYLASGSSDNTLRLWSAESGECLNTLTGHTSRVWDVSSNRSGTELCSGSGDGTVKVWNVSNPAETTCLRTLTGHNGDVYSVRFHPDQHHIVTGGYDKVARLYDSRTGALRKSFAGHTSSISRAIFNPHGNLIITGSKDNTIKFWDILSGSCIKTYSSHLGEVTSIEVNSSGTLLLSSSKDNSNRLWDIRTAKPVKRFKGHQNTSKNFVRSVFGPNEALVVGGSEDGAVYVWDVDSGNLLQKLKGHGGLVYTAAWHHKQSLLASCSEDKTVKTWWYDPSKPVYCEP